MAHIIEQQRQRLVVFRLKQKIANSRGISYNLIFAEEQQCCYGIKLTALAVSLYIYNTDHKMPFVPIMHHYNQRNLTSALVFNSDDPFVLKTWIRSVMLSMSSVKNVIFIFRDLICPSIMFDNLAIL